MSKIYQMGIEATLEIIGGKWKPVILCNLGHGPMRSGELKKKLPDVTQKMLTQQLRELEENDIISREIYKQVHPKVVYSLTEKGKSLKRVLIAMSIWGEEQITLRKEEGKDIVLNGGFEGFIDM